MKLAPNLDYLELAEQVVPREFAGHIYEKYRHDASVFVSFISQQKLGINPKSIYNTPLGIYCYNVAEAWKYYSKTAGSGFDAILMLPFPPMNTAPYAVFFRVKPAYADKVLHSDNFSKEDLKAYLKKLGKVLENSYPSLYKDYAKIVSNRLRVKAHPLKLLFNVMYDVASNAEDTMENLKFSVFWNKLFRSLGIYGVVDSGYGIIYEENNELCQAVFFTKDCLESIGLYNNKLHFGDFNKLKNSKALVDFVKSNIDYCITFALTKDIAKVSLESALTSALEEALVRAKFDTSTIPNETLSDFLSQVSLSIAKKYFVKDTVLQRTIVSNALPSLYYMYHNRYNYPKSFVNLNSYIKKKDLLNNIVITHDNYLALMYAFSMPLGAVLKVIEKMPVAEPLVTALEEMQRNYRGFDTLRKLELKNYPKVPIGDWKRSNGSHAITIGKGGQTLYFMKAEDFKSSYPIFNIGLDANKEKVDIRTAVGIVNVLHRYLTELKAISKDKIRSEFRFDRNWVQNTSPLTPTDHSSRIGYNIANSLSENSDLAIHFSIEVFLD